MEGQQQAMQDGRGAGDAPQLNFMIAKSFNCVIPTLLGVIQVNNEGKDKSPFETHPAQMWVFVFSSVIYFSAAQRSVPMAIISGSLSSVSLLSVLLPRLLGTLIFIPWAFVPLILAYQIHAVVIRNACRQLHHRINSKYYFQLLTNHFDSAAKIAGIATLLHLQNLCVRRSDLVIETCPPCVDGDVRPGS